MQLTITGEKVRDAESKRAFRYMVYINGVAFPCTWSWFDLIVRLTHAKLTDHGYRRIDDIIPSTVSDVNPFTSMVCRLRQSVRETLGNGTCLVSRDKRRGYSLCVAPENIRIAVKPESLENIPGDLREFVEQHNTKGVSIGV